MSRFVVLQFVVYFLLFAFLAGFMVHLSSTAKSFLDPVYVALASMTWVLGLFSLHFALRALSIQVTNRSLNISPDSPPPTDADAPLFSSPTFGPFSTNAKSILFILASFLIFSGSPVSSVYNSEKLNTFQCGRKAFFDMLYETGTINYLGLIKNTSYFLGYSILPYIVWIRFFASIGCPQDSGMKWGYALFSVATSSFILPALGLVHRTVPVILMYSSFFLLMCINCWWDREKPGKPAISNNVAYMSFSTGSVWLAVVGVSVGKQQILEESGAGPAAIFVGVFGIVLTFFYESVTNKASSGGNNGPFIFPLYFGLDLVSVSILLTVDLISGNFVIVVMMQEMLGLARNCGVYDIGIWLFLKVTSIADAGPFPLRSVSYLEKLGTIAAVDSVSEVVSIRRSHLYFVYVGILTKYSNRYTHPTPADVCCWASISCPRSSVRPLLRFL